MMQLITADYYGNFIDEIADMHRLRHRVFKERLDWDVLASGDMEIDEFDALHPAYLLQRANDGRVQGCVRLLPSTGPTMLRDAFPILLDGTSAPASSSVWESSRFALDIGADAREGGSRSRPCDLRAFRRHDRIRPVATAHRNCDSHRNRCPDGTDLAARRMAFAANWQTSRDRQHVSGRRLS